MASRGSKANSREMSRVSVSGNQREEAPNEQPTNNPHRAVDGYLPQNTAEPASASQQMAKEESLSWEDERQKPVARKRDHPSNLYDIQPYTRQTDRTHRCESAKEESQRKEKVDTGRSTSH